ncbi:TetR/AcrR family transcriptional regulator [Pontibacter sp. SGAir0037]|uniref:TetR/AcrR family transcriptional regulator n=1 Tax=Pontibacter sp. SGAir0037 TaxID=2571030 RepID=UPI0010CD5ABB|nr:TetR/AcrR family transcriptional regulator [Pontibacter sp. SGAir0037]QCR21771.1 TetR family transcriptional regulator [Pontibacter sp. SGAir0037]
MENLADKKKAILESTLDLIKENGFHGTPMSMVAKHANVAAGTIYHYFDSKETLICQLFSYVKGRIMDALFEQDDESLDFRVRFFRVWRGLYEFYINNLNSLVFFEQFVNSPYNKKLPKPEHDTFKPLHDFFTLGIEQEYLRPVNPKILTVLAHGSILTAAKVRMAGKIELQEPELEQIIEILWDGMALKKK